jgi:hypothetical protein
VSFQCWDDDEGRGDANDDLIGQCSLPLAEVIDFEREAGGMTWKWEGWRTVRESSGELPADIPDLDAEDHVDRGEMPPDIPYHVAAATAAAERTKQTAEMTKLAAVKSKEKGMAMKDKRAANLAEKKKDASEAMDGETMDNPLAAPPATFEMEDGSEGPAVIESGASATGGEMDGIPDADPEAGMNGAEAGMNGAEAAGMNGADDADLDGEADIEEV